MLEFLRNYLYNTSVMRGRLMVGHQTLDLAILGSTPSPAAIFSRVLIYNIFDEEN